MKHIYNSSMIIARASKGSPVLSVATVMLFYLMFNMFESGVERIIFGERFEHWLDIVFRLGFISYAAFSVYSCAIYNTKINSLEAYDAVHKAIQMNLNRVKDNS